MTLRRLVYVVNVFPKLSETFIAHEVAELRRRGLEVQVLSLRRPAEEKRHAFVGEAGLDDIIHYTDGQWLEALHAFSPQLIHAHFATQPTAAARELAAGLAVPFTFTAHGYDIHRRPPADFLARAAAAQAVVTVSEANARYIAETFAVPRWHLLVIACGVDADYFQPRQEPAADAESRRSKVEPPLLVCVARHARVKNLELLLEACAGLRRRALSFRCVLVGDGPCQTALRARCAELELSEHVEFAGAADRSQVLEWWQQASVAVLSSHSEGMPVCLMEAAACAVPAVATAVGGIPELVVDGLTGLLVPPGEAEALTTALQQLIENPEQTRRMGYAARQRVRQHFSLSKQVDALLNMWGKMI